MPPQSLKVEQGDIEGSLWSLGSFSTMAILPFGVGIFFLEVGSRESDFQGVECHLCSLHTSSQQQPHLEPLSCPLVGERTLPVVGKCYFKAPVKETKFHVTSPSMCQLLKK